MTLGERVTVAAAVLAEGTRCWFPLAASGLLALTLVTVTLGVVAGAVQAQPELAELAVTLDWLGVGAGLLLVGWCWLAPALWAWSVWEAASEVRRWRRSRPFDFAMASRLDAILGPERVPPE